MSTALASSSLSSLSFPSTLTSSTTLMNSSTSSVTGLKTASGSSSSSTSSTASSASSRGKWSVVGTIVSAPIRGYYYPGRVKAIKELIKDSSSTNTGNKNAGSTQNGLIYSIQFSNLDSTPIISNKMNTSSNENENEKQELILDYNGDQLIGRGFEPITKALLSENQKVFITYRNRECSAHVINHDTETDDITLSIDSMPSTPVSALSSSLPLFTNMNGNGTSTMANNNEHDEQRLIVKLQDIRLLPSRKSGRIQEHPDYSILANGGRSRSPIDHHHDERSTLTSTLPNNKSSNININNTSKTMNNRTTGNNQVSQRQRSISGSSLLANGNDSLMFGHPSSAVIDVPTQQSSYNQLPINIPGRKRRPAQNSSMSTATAATVDPHSQQYHHHHQQYGIKNDFITGSSMDECTAALVLMSLSAPPRSPTLSTENRANTRRYKCTWPGCKHKTTSVRQIEQHIRDHKRKDDEEMMSGEEDFYYDVEDASECTIFELRTQPAFAINGNHHNLSSGPDSPVSLSEADAVSNSSSSNSSHVLMAIGDNSMDSSSSPPSPITAQNYFQQAFTVSAFAPCVQTNQYRHLEDHEYNRKPDPAGISILGSGTVINRNRGRKPNNNNVNNNNTITTTTLISSHPINIPNMDHSGHSYNSQTAIGSGSFGASSLSSSGFGSYTGSSLGSSSFSPVSPSRTNNSASLSSTSKYLRMVPGGRNSVTNGALHSISNGHHHHGHHHGSTSLSSSASSAASTNNPLTQQHRTSPTKRIRGETRKCRKMYGMDKKDSWCTQCKWKKACSRFID